MCAKTSILAPFCLTSTKECPSHRVTYIGVSGRSNRGDKGGGEEGQGGKRVEKRGQE